MNRLGSSSVADKSRIDEEREKAHVVLSCLEQCPSRETDWRWRLAHLPVDRWVEPEEFAQHARLGRSFGIAHVEAGPLVRSSYHAASHVVPRASAG